MCGIAGYYCYGPMRPSPATVKLLFKDNVSRGRDAAGVAFLDTDAQPYTFKAAEPATQMADRIADSDWQRIAASPRTLMHCRARTQGTEKHMENNHPVVGMGWLVTHNGQISNDDSLFAAWGGDETRFAEVDSAAINLVLGRQKNDLLGALANLSVLGGSATLAAWPAVEQPEVVALARLGANSLYLAYNQLSHILFWSSMPSVCRFGRAAVRGVPGMTTLAELPDKEVLVLRPSGVAQTERYSLERNPFFRARSATHHTFPTAQASGAPTTTPITETGVSRASASNLPVVSRISWRAEDAGRTPGKPRPDLSGDSYKFWSYTPGAVALKFRNEAALRYLTIDTGYGRWVMERIVGSENEFTAVFKPNRRTRQYWYRSHGRKLTLPLTMSEVQKNLLRDFEVLEPVFLRMAHPGGETQVPGHMCPHCGAMFPAEVWTRTKAECPYCCITSRWPGSDKEGS